MSGDLQRHVKEILAAHTLELLVRCLNDAQLALIEDLDVEQRLRLADALLSLAKALERRPYRGDVELPQR
jgi:hypothetical protein